MDFILPRSLLHRHIWSLCLQQYFPHIIVRIVPSLIVSSWYAFFKGICFLNKKENKATPAWYQRSICMVVLCIHGEEVQQRGTCITYIHTYACIIIYHCFKYSNDKTKTPSVRCLNVLFSRRNSALNVPVTFNDIFCFPIFTCYVVVVVVVLWNTFIPKNNMWLVGREAFLCLLLVFMLLLLFSQREVGEEVLVGALSRTRSERATRVSLCSPLRHFRRP